MKILPKREHKVIQLILIKAYAIRTSQQNLNATDNADSEYYGET